MSIYKIRLNFSDGRENWFFTYKSLIEKSETISQNSSIVFFTKSHAEYALEKFIKVCKTNRSNTKKKSKWDDFLKANPTFLDFSIEEFEDVDSEHLIYVLFFDVRYYFSEINLENELFTLSTNKEIAIRFDHYETIKTTLRKIKEKNWFSHSQLFVETLERI